MERGANKRHFGGSGGGSPCSHESPPHVIFRHPEGPFSVRRSVAKVDPDRPGMFKFIELNRDGTRKPKPRPRSRPVGRRALRIIGYLPSGPVFRGARYVRLFDHHHGLRPLVGEAIRTIPRAALRTRRRNGLRLTPVRA